LEAVARQSLPPDEIIVVDDASTDGSLEVFERFARGCKSARLIRHERNLGVCPTVNAGLAAATGDYVRIQSADDLILPGFFEKSMAMLATYPRAAFSSALGLVVGRDGSVLGPNRTPVIASCPIYVPPEEAARSLEHHGFWIVSYAAIFKRSSMLREGGNDPELGAMADSYLDVALLIKEGGCFIPERLACWRKLDGSYALGQSIAAFMAANARLNERLAALPGLPKTFVRRWTRERVNAVLYEADRQGEVSAADASRMIGLMPARGISEKLLLLLLKRRPERRRLWIKLYIFLQQSLRDKMRIAAGKFAKIFSD
jgi:hypothetical protein